MTERLITLQLRPRQAMLGVFVPWNPKRTDKRSANVGWITDVNGCDIWQGGNTKGYGVVRVGSRLCLVHRVRYEREIGPIPEGMELDHYVCDNGPGGCCNPLHCRPAAHRENTLRGNTVTAGHAAKTHCPQGHPLSGKNLKRTKLGRTCRTCQNVYSARAHRRRRL